ncbi:MAG: ATP synthase F0 subunit B [Acidobacteria bacterium]|nr:ATP synthase F0 subunit B [Acidobacteriota bacterium]
MRRPTAVLLIAVLVSLPLATALAASEAEGEHPQQGALKELIFKWLNFVLVFGALGYMLRKPLAQAFAEQRAAIRGAIEEARQARAQAQARLQEIEQRLARLEQEVEAMRREAGENAASEKQRIRQTAQRESERILATTRAEMDSVTRAARLELRAYAARLAVSLAEQSIQKQLTPEVQTALFQASVSHFQDRGRRP